MSVFKTYPKSTKVAVVAALSFYCAVSPADFVTTIDGRRIEGLVIEESEREIKIDTMIGSIRTTLTLQRADIYSIIYHPVSDDYFQSSNQRPTAQVESIRSKQDNHCIIIPLKGLVGEEITTRGVAACLEYALRRGIKEIVLEIDTLGGIVKEAEEISSLLHKHKDHFNYTAIVHNAVSAGIWFAAVSNTIYFYEDSLIGAAVVLNVDQSGVASPVDAKFQSYISAKVEALAISNNHDPLLFRAMVVQDASVFFVFDPESNRKVLAPTSPHDVRLLVEMLDSDKTVLTLTGRKAVEVGLGSVFPPEGLPWKQHGDVGAKLIQIEADRRRREIQNQVRTVEADRQRREKAKNKIEDDLEKIQTWSKHLEKLVKRAEQSDPRRFNDYEVEFIAGKSIRVESVPGTSVVRIRNEFDGTVTKRLTLNGMRLWQKRTDDCIRQWRDIIAGCNDVSDLLKEYPPVSGLEVYRVQIEDFRRLANTNIQRLREER